MSDEDVRDKVSDFYGEVARRAVAAEAGGAERGSSTPGPWGTVNYDDHQLANLPTVAGAASVGCGNPLARAGLTEGDVVLDLGSGGGIDVLLSAGRVGPTGHVYGLEMSDDMLDLARRNLQEAQCSNVEFLKGYLEEIPLPDDWVDVVISNCVVNLSPDKAAVFTEIGRVLRHEGRLSIADVAAETETAADGLDPQEWESCFAGALTRREYRAGLTAVGFIDIEISAGTSIREGFSSVSITAKRTR